MKIFARLPVGLETDEICLPDFIGNSTRSRLLVLGKLKCQVARLFTWDKKNPDSSGTQVVRIFPVSRKRACNLALQLTYRQYYFFNTIKCRADFTFHSSHMHVKVVSLAGWDMPLFCCPKYSLRMDFCHTDSDAVATVSLQLPPGPVTRKPLQHSATEEYVASLQGNIRL